MHCMIVIVLGLMSTITATAFQKVNRSVKEQTGSELVKVITEAHQLYFEKIKDMSFKCYSSSTENGTDMSQSIIEAARDKHNAISIVSINYNRYINEPRLMPPSNAVISRLRSGRRQILSLRRSDPAKPWVITSDISDLASENQLNDFLFQDEERARSGIGAATEFMNSFDSRVVNLINLPSFRLNSKSEETVNKERLVTLDFTIDPPLNKSAAQTIVKSGRLILRPEHYWTVKKGSFIIELSTVNGGVIEQVDTTVEYGEEEKDKALPKTMKCVNTIRKGDRQWERINTTKYEFTTNVQLPEERLSLTQFGLTEREPVSEPAEGTEEPVPVGARKNYVAPHTHIPLYVWFSVSGLLLLGLGVGLRLWIARATA